MNLRLRTIDELADAEALLPLLQRGAEETGAAYLSDEELESAARRYLDDHFAADESLILVGESDGKALAVAATAPFVDPLSGARRPIVVILWVDPSLRHRGVARGLMGELRRRLAAAGQRSLMARAEHNDDALISMGERWGMVRAWELLSWE